MDHQVSGVYVLFLAKIFMGCIRTYRRSRVRTHAGGEKSGFCYARRWFWQTFALGSEKCGIAHALLVLLYCGCGRDLDWLIGFTNGKTELPGFIVNWEKIVKTVTETNKRTLIQANLK
ncbi:hypothetical protein V6N13_049373 [Hibiscus sabdariffa]